MSRSCYILRLGLVEYGEAFRLQRAIATAREKGALPDVMIALEHPPVLTLGRRANPANILAPEERLTREGVVVQQSSRGGDVTYHGPGQLVGYPILALRPLGMGAHRYVHTLEGVIIDLLRDFGIEARRDANYIGVWVGEEKIAAIGVAISGGITTHGFALNVDPNLSHFRLINPCGITDKGVTSMARLLGRPVEVPEVLPSLTHHFARWFEMEMVPCPSNELAAAGIRLPDGAVRPSLGEP
jgi:lipoyl(octanoyl) transferase